MKRKLKAIDFLILILDIAITAASFFIAYLVRDNIGTFENPLFSFWNYTWILWFFIPTQYLSFVYFGLYGSKKTNAPLSIFVTMIKAFGMTALISAAAVFFSNSDIFSRFLFVIFVITDFILLLMEKFAVRWYILGVIDKNKAKKRVIIVGVPENEEKIVKALRSNDDWAVNITGFVNIESDLSSLHKTVVENTADEVYFVVSEHTTPDMEAAMSDCEALGITVRVLLNLFDFKFSKTQLSYAGKIPMLTFHTVSLNEGQLMLKRLTDILGSVVGLIFTGILTLFIAPAIKLDSKGPVFFKQKRVGRNGRVFTIYKYRTMVTDAESRLSELKDKNELTGAVFKMENDPRVTRVGRFLRKTSLDEFPQFLNVFKGDMSLVGTRPPTLGEVEEYKLYHRRRLSIKPGLTGMWQVSGRNEITDFEDIYALDISYIDNWSIALDIKILFKTVGTVLTRKGVK